jgi:transcription elongation factor Elf1
MDGLDSKTILIKRLITGKPTMCPSCNQAYLEHFHKKAKKSNTDYICPCCGKRYQIIKMLRDKDN